MVIREHPPPPLRDPQIDSFIPSIDFIHSCDKNSMLAWGKQCHVGVFVDPTHCNALMTDKLQARGRIDAGSEEEGEKR